MNPTPSTIRRQLRCIADLRPETISSGPVTLDREEVTIPEVAGRAEKLIGELEMERDRLREALEAANAPRLRQALEEIRREVAYALDRDADPDQSRPSLEEVERIASEALEREGENR